MTYKWWHDAACKGLPTEDMFFDKSDGKKAKSVCAKCPVLVECRDAAFEEEAGHGRYIYGVRGGMTADERRKEQSKRRRDNRIWKGER